MPVLLIGVLPDTAMLNPIFYYHPGIQLPGFFRLFSPNVYTVHYLPFSPNANTVHYLPPKIISKYYSLKCLDGVLCSMNKMLNRPAPARDTAKSIADEIQAFRVKITPAIIADCKDINTALGMMETPAHYATHYANPALKSFGIMGIIRQVLTAHNAIFARNAADMTAPAQRAAAIQGSLFTYQIVILAKPFFAIAGLRYKPQAVKNVLSTYGTAEIVKISLTSGEDVHRPCRCRKPRAKWFLAAKPQ